VIDLQASLQDTRDSKDAPAFVRTGLRHSLGRLG
jgi:hypothetical protein